MYGMYDGIGSADHTFKINCDRPVPKKPDRHSPTGKFKEEKLHHFLSHVNMYKKVHTQRNVCEHKKVNENVYTTQL